MTRNPWQATVLTVFPEMFPGPLGQSLAGKGLEKGSWALDVLAEEGFRYDSSVFPIRHDRYGVPDAPRQRFILVARTMKANVVRNPSNRYR